MSADRPSPAVAPWLRRGAALLAGAAASLSFLPSSAAPLFLSGFVVLMALWARDARARDAAATGFAFGLGLFGAGVSWVYISMARFGGMPPPLAAVATLGLCMYLAAFPALVGAIQARMRGRGPLAMALFIPALWTLAEWLREWLFTGFPWLAIGHASPGTPAQALAPIAGGHAAGFALLALCGLVECAIRGAARRTSIAMLAGLIGVGIAADDLEWTQPSGVVKTALLQGNIAQDLKFEPGRYAKTLDTYARLAAASGARLVVMPETALPRFLDDIDPAYLARLRDDARRAGGDVLVGVPYRDRETGRYYNSLVSLGSSPTQRYDKRHLVPFGEFIPPGFRWVLGIMSIPLADFSRGDREPAPLEVAGVRVAANICYEDAFGSEIRRALPEANLLVNVSNVAWFGDSLAPAQHLQIARLRAIEAGRMHLAATNTGITAAIDRDGRVLARLPQFEEGRLEVTAVAYEGATPYVRIGDAPLLILCALIVAAFIAVARHSPTR